MFWHSSDKPNGLPLRICRIVRRNRIYSIPFNIGQIYIAIGLDLFRAYVALEIISCRQISQFTVSAEFMI